MFNIVLVHPDIPQNTGNIVRTCAATNSILHLIKPLGFSVSDKYLKRAGLDYWSHATVKIYNSFEEFEEKNPGNYFLVTSKGSRSYTDFKFKTGDYLIFGSETAGLPDSIHEKYRDTRMRIPMIEGIRCLNLSNAVAVIIYEGERQNSFNGFV
ncbi:MAG: tRNA (uridine(34)/cytosine(34)/5-carboxymethylaminomethyluridine(34)-2'-O)-methyltransferase TrmL [Lachnospiraceae bacterium]|nr:tRNA (uridine(34)/cytosine(34)/5-carboxymethylaminomethyluridine(34)-2'-O)-methyltransferase TrmL [Lachnospiraceae bacterium]